MKTTQTLAIVSATLAMTLTMAFDTTAFAQEAYGYQLQAPAATSSLSRAEVEADTRLWLKAGLSTYDGNQAADFSVPGYAESVASYQALRNGPAYFAELRRIQGTGGDALASGPAPAAKTE